MSENICSFSYCAVENQRYLNRSYWYGITQTDLTLNIIGHSQDIIIEEWFEKNTVERNEGNLSEFWNLLLILLKIAFWSEKRKIKPKIFVIF